MAPMFVEPFVVFSFAAARITKICKTRVICLLLIVCVYSGFWSSFGHSFFKEKAAWLHEQCFARIIIESFAREKRFGSEQLLYRIVFVLCYNMH